MINNNMRLNEFNEIDLQKMSAEDLLLLANQQLDEMIEITDEIFNERIRTKDNQLAS